TQIGHAELLGLAPAWRFFRGRPERPAAFRTPGAYRFVRHPLMLGTLLLFWAAPVMTADRLLLAASMTADVLAALRWEEADLQREFGPKYEDYRRRVPLLIPWKGRAV